MATGAWRAPCVADLMLTTMLMMATLDDPKGNREGVTREVRRLDGLGGRWMRTSLPRALRTSTHATRPTVVESLPAVVSHTA